MYAVSFISIQIPVKTSELRYGFEIIKRLPDSSLLNNIINYFSTTNFVEVTFDPSFNIII